MTRRDLLIRALRAVLGGLAAWVAAACGNVIPTSSQAPPKLTTSSPSLAQPALTGPPARPVLRVPRSPRIALENLREGGSGWRVRGTGASPAQGYLDRVSAGAGDQIRLLIGTSSVGPIEVEWYRLGWYQGLGGRLVRSDHIVSPGPRRPPVLDRQLGLAEADFDEGLRLVVPDDWLSGMYLAVLRPRQGPASYVPFVVRPASSDPAPVLFVSAATTWQAYNGWGGKSLYGYNSFGPPTVTGARAAQVSFERPYADGSGSGFLFRWELPFVRWQERNGRDVQYVADVDLALHPDLLAGRRLLVFAGHHEYWSRPMREAVEAAVGAGTNVAFLSANEIYWSVRLDGSPNGPARRMTCYKSALLDPLATIQPAVATTRWRAAPLLEPEARLVGQMYGHVVKRPADWIVTGADHWLYAGTGLRDGDHLVNLVGQEYDTLFPSLAPLGTQLLAQGPVVTLPRKEGEVGDLPSPGVHTATIYTAASGATVFAAGTFQWSWALPDDAVHDYHGFRTPHDPRVAVMTRNLFDRLGDGPA